MRNTKIIVACVCFLVLIASVSAQPCPDDEEFLDLLKRAIIYLVALFNFIKEFIYFYNSSDF